MNFEKTMSPLQIGGMTIRNRIIMPAMGSNLAEEDGSINDRIYSYYVARAKGGFGLVIVEVCSIDEMGYSIAHEPAIWDDKFLPGLTRLVKGVHEYGGKICLQLHHAGRDAGSPVQPVAPSSIKMASSPHFRSRQPRELTTAEVWELIEKFGNAAIRAKKAGADAVEIHSAHQYLVAQFSSPFTNKRTDEFGGSFENRMRFAVEIIKNIRKKTGDDFPVLIRISGDERAIDGRQIYHSQLMARYLEQAGVDAIHVSVGAGNSNATVSPSSYPEGFNIGNAKAIKEAVSVPVIAVGRLHDPYFIEMALQMGWADGISVGRQSIADPYFPHKIATGRLNEICPCVSCLQGCVGRLNDPDFMAIYCLMNPFAGREYHWKIIKADYTKKIAVVGGGPAGMQFAWLAAARGHNVVLFEKGDRLGGQVLLAAVPPHKQPFATAIRYWEIMCKKYDVDIRLNSETTVGAIAAEKPDIVVVATGAKPAYPPFKGLDQNETMDAWDVLAGKVEVGHKAIIIGGGLVGCETADYLAAQAHIVTIVEMMPDLVSELALGQQWAVSDLLDSVKEKCEIKTGSKVIEILKDGIVIEKEGKLETLANYNSVILACGSKPFNPFDGKLTQFPQVHVIGDASKVRKIIDATDEGTKLALEI